MRGVGLVRIHNTGANTYHPADSHADPHQFAAAWSENVIDHCVVFVDQCAANELHQSGEIGS